MKSLIRLGALAQLAWGAVAAPAAATALDYEYIVIGSGAGGGPVAARLALAGHKTLLIEAGDDQGSNVNYTVPAYQAKSTEDPLMAWDFFVRHYSSDERQKLDYKLTYDTPDGGEYIGLNPPAGSKIRGVLYPRSATLGGCTAHNALVTVYPDESDFEGIVALTGDSSWNPRNMRNYWKKIEHNNVPNVGPGHGFNGWLGVSTAPLTLALQDTQLLSQVDGGATAVNSNLAAVIAGDCNADSKARDTTAGAYQIPIATQDGHRSGSREFILSVANAKNADGSKKYPLDLRMNCFVTKVTFDKSASPPRATGVEFLDGQALYRADKRSGHASPGKKGSAAASREVIVSGGSYNSPQILQLSGVGPAALLRKYNIPVVADLPGVGTNLQDHYEVVVQGQSGNNFTSLDDCNFGFASKYHPIPATSDPCYNKWVGDSTTVTYASSGFAAGLLIKTPYAPGNDFSSMAFGGPVNFRGYYPGYSYDATSNHNFWSWAILKSHPRNRAGHVKIRSADPLDTPDILFNYFDTGSGDYEKDLEEIWQSILTARKAFSSQDVEFLEVLPGADVQSKADIETYVKNTAWGHHCSSTCPIGADNDPMAVLDSSFRVRKVQGLRVVDASVYPHIPGVFTAASTYLVGEKAADVILQQLGEN